jgi:hypothetical protein
MTWSTSCRPSEHVGQFQIPAAIRGIHAGLTRGKWAITSDKPSTPLVAIVGSARQEHIRLMLVLAAIDKLASFPETGEYVTEALGMRLRAVAAGVDH